MNKFKQILLTVSISLFSTLSIAQDQIDYNTANSSSQIEMADQFRADGKIYIVVIVILIILAGMLFYLYRTDRKLKKLEKEQNIS